MTTRNDRPGRVSPLTLRASFMTVIISRTSAEGFRLAWYTEPYILTVTTILNDRINFYGTVVKWKCAQARRRTLEVVKLPDALKHRATTWLSFCFITWEESSLRSTHAVECLIENCTILLLDNFASPRECKRTLDLRGWHSIAGISLYFVHYVILMLLSLCLILLMFECHL